MQIEEKAKILRSHAGHCELARYYTAEYFQYRQKVSTAYSRKQDGMPKSDAHSDVSDYIAKMEELENYMYDQKEKAENMKLNIMTWIEKLPEVNERLVLMYHFIDGHNLGWIAEKMHFSVRTIKRIKKSALHNLEDPDTASWLGWNDVSPSE